MDFSTGEKGINIIIEISKSIPGPIAIRLSVFFSHDTGSHIKKPTSPSRSLGAVRLFDCLIWCSLFCTCA